MAALLKNKNDPPGPHSAASATSSELSCSDCGFMASKLCAAVCGKPRGEEDNGPGPTPIEAISQTFPARRTICRPSELSEFVPVVCRGWAASSLVVSDGRRQILTFLLPGDIVSAASLFGPVLGRTVEAITDVTIRSFRRSDLHDNFLKHTELFDAIIEAWLEEEERIVQLAVDLGRRTANVRLARLILNLADRLTKRGMMRGPSMEFPLRQHHIADATGLTPVHVSKVLGEFQRGGLIEINNRWLTIKDVEALRREGEMR
jgi:CRP/FNR family transcriptional regulator